MRWTLRISFLLFLAWAIFMVSPFVALHDLGKAVEAKDLARIENRVNFNALRVSLSRQILGAYLNDKELGGLDEEVAAEVGASALNPFIEELVTPQALVDLLDDGRPQQAAALDGGYTSPLRLDLSSAKMMWQTFIQSESRGFRSVTIPVPVNSPEAEKFKLTFRLKGTTWRLSGVDLPDNLRQELIRHASLDAREEASQPLNTR